MKLELSTQQRKDAVASLRQYFERNLPEEIGELPAGLLLDYFLEEIGPVLYNRGIHDAQARLQQRLADLEGELCLDAFQYWTKAGKRTR